MFTISKAKSDISTTVCSAISSRCLIEFYYHGGYHLVEPFCLGALTAADGESLLCYQVSGYSEFGEPVGWKLFRASEIANLKITEEHFNGSRPDYNPDKFRWSTICCCLGTDNAAGKPGEAATLIPSIKRARPGKESQQKVTATSLTHNELMRRFRLAHLIFPWQNRS